MSCKIDNILFFFGQNKLVSGVIATGGDPTFLYRGVLRPSSNTARGSSPSVHAISRPLVNHTIPSVSQKLQQPSPTIGAHMRYPDIAVTNDSFISVAIRISAALLLLIQK